MTQADRTTLHVVNGRVVTMDPAIGELPDGGEVLIRDGEIAAIGHDLETPPGARRLDARGGIVMPGLVDTHTHLWNGVWRTFANTGEPDAGYEQLGNEMGPLYRPEESYIAVRAALLEMIGSGITTTHNWAHNVVSPEHADSEVQAMVDTGIRGRFSYGYRWDLPVTEVMDLKDVLRVRDRWTSPMLSVGLALRNDATPAGDWRMFQRLNCPPHVLAEEVGFARSHEIPLTMHVINPGEADYYLRNGYVGPDNLIVHGYHWQGSEWTRLGDAGARVSISPFSRLLGQRKPIPLGDMLDANVRVGMSFDHMNRSGRADMFRLMHSVVVNESLRIGEPLPWRTAIELATIRGAAALGMEDVIGSLTPGKRGDLIILDARSLSMAPVRNLTWAIANSASPEVVSTVVVDGRVLKEDGRLVGWDTDAVADELVAVFDGLVDRYRRAQA